MMVEFIDTHKDIYGAEPICHVLPIALSAYYAHKAQERDPQHRTDRSLRDDVLSCDIQRVWNQNFCVYGARNVWRQLLRKGNVVARCTVERLMGIWGLSGAILGKRYCDTTQPDESMERSKDLVQRNFTAEAPNHLWGADSLSPTSSDEKFQMEGISVTQKWSGIGCSRASHL